MKYQNYVQKVFECFFVKKTEEDRLECLKQIYIDLSDNQQMKILYSNFVPYDKNIRGYSGAIIGYIKNKPGYVMKINKISKKMNANKAVKYDVCYFLFNSFNEVLVNVLLSNLPLISKYVNFPTAELNLCKRHILKIKDVGIIDNNICLIFPLIGYKDEKGRMNSTLKDVFVRNHLPNLIHEIKNNNESQIALYDHYLVSVIDKYYKVMTILNRRINYINSDTKLSNIFIRKRKNTKKIYSNLRKDGFFIDIVPLIADLDKANLDINNVKILSQHKNSLLKYISKLLGYSRIIHEARYDCVSNFGKKYKRYKLSDIDKITLMFDIYANIYQAEKRSKIKIIKQLNILNYYFKKIFNLSQNEFKYMLKCIKGIRKYENITLAISLSKKIHRFLNYTEKKYKKEMRDKNSSSGKKTKKRSYRRSSKKEIT